jgi:nicotinamidase-related amidase
MWFAGLDYCVTDPAYTSNAYASCRLDWVKKTGKKKLVIAGLWTEVCVSLPVIDALAVGREVYMSPTRVGSCRRQARNPSSSVGNPSL